MPDDDLRGLLQNPKESYDVELKSWIDPASPEGKAKIAKASIALRKSHRQMLWIGA